MGARAYSSDSATEFIGYPENKFSWTLEEPQPFDPTDLFVDEDDIDESALNTPGDDKAVSFVAALGTVLASVTLLAF